MILTLSNDQEREIKKEGARTEGMEQRHGQTPETSDLFHAHALCYTRDF